MDSLGMERQIASIVIVGFHDLPEGREVASIGTLISLCARKLELYEQFWFFIALCWTRQGLPVLSVLWTTLKELILLLKNSCQTLLHL